MKEPKPESILAAQLLAEHHAWSFAKHPTAYACARDAMRLCDLARRATTVAVRQGNGVNRYDAQAKRALATWTDSDQASCDRSLARIEKAANEILEPYGAKVLTVHGDPRSWTEPGSQGADGSEATGRNAGGRVMRIALASGATNACEGWGI